MDDNALARKAMHIQRDMFMHKQKCWMSDFHATLTATAYGREIWERWNAVENFRVPYVRVTLHKDGKVETEDWHASIVWTTSTYSTRLDSTRLA